MYYNRLIYADMDGKRATLLIISHRTSMSVIMKKANGKNAKNTKVC